MPRLSMMRASSGNISPMAKPNTATAAMAAMRLKSRCLSTRLVPNEPAARQHQPAKEEHIRRRESEGHGIDAEKIDGGTGERGSDGAAHAPHCSNRRRPGDEIAPGEAVTQNRQRHRIGSKARC